MSYIKLKRNSNKINKFIIFGERCSGTNFLEEMMLTNFEIEIIGMTHSYPGRYNIYNMNHEHHKHFFGHLDIYENMDDVLYIAIVRNPFKWINSLFKTPHHLKVNKEHEELLYNEICSLFDDGNEILHDRNIYTNEPYKNILDLRNVKNKFLYHDLPEKVGNYIFINHENLNLDLLQCIQKTFDLTKKNNELINVFYYKKEKTKIFKESSDLIISLNEIIEHPFYDSEFEKILGYNESKNSSNPIENNISKSIENNVQKQIKNNIRKPIENNISKPNKSFNQRVFYNPERY